MRVRGLEDPSGSLILRVGSTSRRTRTPTANGDRALLARGSPLTLGLRLGRVRGLPRSCDAGPTFARTTSPTPAATIAARPADTRRWRTRLLLGSCRLTSALATYPTSVPASWR